MNRRACPKCRGVLVEYIEDRYRCRGCGLTPTYCLCRPAVQPTLLDFGGTG